MITSKIHGAAPVRLTLPRVTTAPEHTIMARPALTRANPSVERVRAMNSDTGIWCVTANLQVSYLRPTPNAGPVELRARVQEAQGRKTLIACSLFAEGAERATAELLAIRVPPEWRDAEGGQH